MVLYATRGDQGCEQNCQAGQRQRRNIKSPAMKIFCFSSAKQCFFEFQRGGLGSPCGYDATSPLTIAILDWCVLK